MATSLPYLTAKSDSDNLGKTDLPLQLDAYYDCGTVPRQKNIFRVVIID